MNLPLALDHEQVAAFCKRNHIRKLSFFGSVLTDRFTDESDVDMLVEFDKGKEPGLFGMVRMERELGEIIGRKVDLRTAAELSRYFRDKVLAQAEPLYAP
jgi:uncharacterized protein